MKQKQKNKEHTFRICGVADTKQMHLGTSALSINVSTPYRSYTGANTEFLQSVINSDQRNPS
jgi:hypothetical protein